MTYLRIILVVIFFTVTFGLEKSRPYNDIEEIQYGHKSQTKGNVPTNKDLTNLVNKLWNMDKNRMKYGSDIKLSIQGHAPWWNDYRDYAYYPLFNNVDNYLMQKPTYRAFANLLNNYNKNVGTQEVITNEERSEINLFIKYVLDTEVMKEAISFLRSRGKISNFSHNKLYDLWFRPYYRSSVQDSSGFEHVFVGEINKKKNVVSGFHNWIQMYMEEKKKAFDYRGYLKVGKNPHILISRFQWGGINKPIGSSFIGTSPEFEMALYTTVYLMGYTEIKFPLAGTQVKVTCYGINRGTNIGSCFPDIV